MTTDITRELEREPLNREKPRTCKHGYIPVADEPCPDCFPLEAAYLRLVAGGTSREDAAIIVDAGFMDDRQMVAQEYQEAA